MDRESANFHVEYMDVIQHWSPNSEAYAGGDALVTFLFEGWEMQPEILSETKWFGGMRQCMVYHVTLSRDTQKLVMPVINNPYVHRLVSESEFTVKHMTTEQAYSDK